MMEKHWRFTEMCIRDRYQPSADYPQFSQEQKELINAVLLSLIHIFSSMETDIFPFSQFKWWRSSAGRTILPNPSIVRKYRTAITS